VVAATSGIESCLRVPCDAYIRVDMTKPTHRSRPALVALWAIVSLVTDLPAIPATAFEVPPTSAELAQIWCENVRSGDGGQCTVDLDAQAIDIFLPENMTTGAMASVVHAMKEKNVCLKWLDQLRRAHAKFDPGWRVNMKNKGGWIIMSCALGSGQ
jgi:hypothetical protein